MVAMQKECYDYYPFGMPMPNRNSINNNYRYAYQGQEKDPETGKEAFELRLWDGRIGRWLTTDPYGEFHSPYLGMGNNPVNTIDPDGAWHYDKSGHLVSDTGDTEASLATFLNVSGDVAHDIFSKEGFLANVNTDAYGIAGGQEAFGSYKIVGNTTSVRSANYNYMNIFTPMYLKGQKEGAINISKAMALPFIISGAALALTEQGGALLLQYGKLAYKNTMRADSLYELGGEVLANTDDLTNINVSGILFKGKYGDVVSSFVKISPNGVSLNSLDDAIVNFTATKSLGKVHGSLEKGAKLLNDKGAVNVMKHAYSTAASTGVKLLSK